MVGSLVPGARIDRYEVERVMASGGHGTVALVTHVHLGTQHALKVLRVEDDGRRARLLREGRIQASLRHPNIIGVTDVVAIDRGLALVMEFVDGPDLYRWLQRCAPTVDEVDLFAEQLFDAVAEAHARGIIHRDLKPDNVLVERVGDTLRLRVTDFGLAVDEGDQAGRLTMDGTAMGTPRYMAPELYVDARTADARADLFGLGAMLYELLAGEPPFAMGTVVESYGAAMAERFTPLASCRPDVPARMDAAVTAAMRAAPDARPADIVALRTLWRGDAPVPSRGFRPQALAAAAPVAAAPPLLPTRSLPDGGTMSPGPGPSLIPSAASTTALPPRSEPAPGPQATVVGAPPPQRPLLWLASGMLGVGGVLTLGALSGLAWYLLRSEPTPEVAATPPPVVTAPPTAPEEAPRVEPAAEPDTTGVTAPVPSPVAARSTAAAPSPSAAAPSPSAAAPSPSAAAPNPSASAPSRASSPVTPPAAASAPSTPEPEAAARGTASVTVTGASRARLVTPGGASVALSSSLTPGAYGLDVWFTDDAEPTRVMEFTLAAGDRRKVRCEAGLRTCR